MGKKATEGLRAGRWAREQSRLAQLRFLKRNRFWMSAFSIVVVVVSAGVLALWPSVPTALTVGVLATSWFWLLAMVTLQYSGAASTFMGASAEELTSSALQELQGRGWRVFDAFPLNSANHDLDHLAIGPPGVFAIETKWSGSGWFSARQGRHLQSCIQQSRRGAERFTRMRSGFSLRDQPIHPVLVVWAPNSVHEPDAERFRVMQGVTVVRGPSLSEWADALGEETLSPEAIERAAGDVARHLATRESHVLGEHPGRYVRDGGDAVISDTIRAVSSAVLGVVATMYASAVLAGTSWTAAYVGAACLMTVSWIAWRNRRNPVLLGWAVGASASAPIMATWWLAERLA